jgi:hypothetical protein
MNSCLKEGCDVGNRTKDYGTVSGLGFTVSNEDLKFVNEYQGKWVVTETGASMPNNYWVVTTDGKGHPVRGHGSPIQMLMDAKADGLDIAYAAPYGRYVEGEDDGVQLSDWIRERRNKNNPPPIDGNQPMIAENVHHLRGEHH